MNATIHNSMDIRLLRFSKWVLPKTTAVSSISFPNHATISASYFDTVEVLKLKHEKKLIPNQMDRDSFHTKHAIYLYAPANNSNDRRRIQNFWKLQAESTSPLYVCMVRLTDNKLCSETVNEHIYWAFHERARIPKSKMLCYYSLDFCDLVIFVQGVPFSQYLAAVGKLSFCAKEINERIVRDTISIYAVRPAMLANTTLEETSRSNTDRVNLTLRLGVLDFNCLSNFCKAVRNELFLEKDDPNVNFEMSLGRSDFTLYARGKDYTWVIKLCQILDRFTSNDTSGFLTFDINIGADYQEIASKIRNANPLPAQSSHPSKLYEQAKELEKCCSECQRLLQQQLSIDISCLSEIQIALTDLLKDGFAQDLVLSIYESFRHLIDYIKRFCKKDENQAEDPLYIDGRNMIQGLLESYATHLAMIVNCTMHSDREFIQVPAFNLFIQSVPPKLLAFYTSIANQIAKLLTEGDHVESRFTFLFVPSYKDGVNVLSLMPTHELNNRILAINVQEKLLASPKALLPLIGHEIAHYAGRETRMREYRANCYLDSLLAFQLDRAFFSRHTSGNASALCAEFAGVLREAILAHHGSLFQDYHFTALLGSVRRSQHLLDLLGDEIMRKATLGWAKIILKDPDKEDTKSFVNYWIEVLDSLTQAKYLAGSWHNSESKQECIRIICEWCYRQISITFGDEDAYRDLFCWFDWLESAYRESYSDVVMLSLLNITTAEDYNDIIDKNIIENNGSEYNILRVSAVTAVLGEPDLRWQELNIGAPSFQQCAIKRLTEYLQRCKEQLDRRMESAENVSSIGQIYQTLRSNNCTADYIFSLLRDQSKTYLDQLCGIPIQD